WGRRDSSDVVVARGARHRRAARQSSLCRSLLHSFRRMTAVLALCAELLSIKSPTGGEGKIVEFVSRRLVSRGWNVTVQEVTPGRGNVWASRSGGGVTLSTHLDTVPPYVAPK